MNPSIPSLITRLQDLLMTERTLLQAGRARETAALAEGKMTAMEEMEAAINAAGEGTLSGSVRRQVEALVQMAKENSQHFDAVRRGIRNITARIENLDGNTSVGAYDQYGAKMPFRGATGGYLRKV